ncbi:MAG: LysM peptidoglycan-binding domain-containing protein [Bauldia sp.]|nr:LysM peptidoglycan-binding domain-containing protein [Bauldia sp.]
MLQPRVRTARAAVLILSAALIAAASDAAAQSAGAPVAYDVLPVGPGGAPVFVGTAEPGAIVELLDGAIVVATGVANARGEWILAAPGPVGNPETFTVRVTSPGGRFQTLPTPGRTVAEPPAGTPVTATLADGRVDGTAAPDIAVTVAGIGPVPFAALADGEGRWIVVLPRLPAGAYQLRVAAADAPADTILLDLVLPLDPAYLRVEVAIAAPAIAEAAGTLAGPRFVVVGPRDTLWDIAVRAYGDGTRYRDIFTANRDQLRDPRRIFAGQVLLIP